MTRPRHNLIVLDEPSECDLCKSLQQQVDELTRQNERLRNAIVRESHHMDARVVRNRKE